MNGPVRDIRDELLARHAEMRAAVNDIQVAVERVRSGNGPPEELQTALADLADALRVHCAHEDDVLREVLRNADAWGDARVEVLDNEHAHERGELDDAVVESGLADDVERLVAITLRCVARLLEHFAREERFALAEDVLCDGIVARNSFCG
jgi:hypothetical protein